VRHVIRRKNDTIHTKDACVNWIRRFILFHTKTILLNLPIASLRAKKPRRLSTRLTRDETLRMINRMSGT